ncbi:MAG: hypothetical protein ACE5H7_09960 [Acidiferrobacterales bacterium]
MTTSPLFVPNKKVSAWVTETRPKEARAWLNSLPLADDGDSARDIYQALYTLNRLEVAPQNRLELMELYQAPVATVSSLLGSQFRGLALPLAAELRQLAEFIRQLKMEMAIGYKCAINDLQAARLGWSRRQSWILASERAMWYLGEVLLNSYQVYMPPPPGVWREIHALFRLAEEQDRLTEAIELADEGDTRQTNIYERYRQIVLLGLCNPYQLVQTECALVSVFLQHRSEHALVSKRLDVADPTGQFLIDLSRDVPPAPFPLRRQVQPSADLRVLNTIELARVVHGLIKRLEQGEAVGTLDLSPELRATAWRDLLRRMIKFWGLPPKRQYARNKIQGRLSLCTGINALHFFGSGRNAFEPPDDDEQSELQEQDEATDKNVQAQDRNSQVDKTKGAGPQRGAGAVRPRWLAQARVATPESFPVDRWQLRDESARGLQLSREGGASVQVRIGDVLGIQSPHDAGAWRVGVVRWIKSPEAKRIDMGVERLAPAMTPAAVKPVSSGRAPVGRYTQALLLPAMPALRRPPTLLVARGVYEPNCDLHLVTGQEPARIVRPSKLLERTASFDLIAFVEVDAR